MNLTPAERAAMVRDLRKLADSYYNLSYAHASFTAKHRHCMEMSDNYSALVAALKEGLTFQATT